MSAALTDNLMEVAAESSITTLAGDGKAVGQTSIQIASASGWPTATAFVFAIRQVDASGVEVAGTYTEWIGTLSGTTITMSLGGAPSPVAGSDQEYAAGSTTQVYIPVSSTRDNKLITALLNQHNQDGSHSAITATSIAVTGENEDRGVDLAQYRADMAANFISDGCVWTADAPGSTRNASMSSGHVYIGGKRLVVASITAHTFTASKDTYVDFQDNGDGTAHVYFTEATNNAASPALGNSGTTANTVRCAIVVTGASNIADSNHINQGQITASVPVVSSLTLVIGDSIGNLIFPQDPETRVRAYEKVGEYDNIGTSSYADISIALTAICTNRPIRVKYQAALETNFSGSATCFMLAQLLVDGSQTGAIQASPVCPINQNGGGFTMEWIVQPGAGSHTFKVQGKGQGAAMYLNDVSEVAGVFGSFTVEEV